MKGELKYDPETGEPLIDGYPLYSGLPNRKRDADLKIGAWLSAALEDPSTCQSMKDDINEWFECTPQVHSIPMQNQHGYCPNCGMDFDGDLIWETGLEMYENEQLADDYAKAYGATRTTGRWGKCVGIYDMRKDMTTSWMCPECKHEWPRS